MVVSRASSSAAAGSSDSRSWAASTTARTPAPIPKRSSSIRGYSGPMRVGFELDEYVLRALRAGASGFLLKGVEPTELLNAIRLVAAGDALLAPSVTRTLLERFAVLHEPGPEVRRRLEELTPRELEVLTLVGTGLTNADIAARLVLSPATVKTHVNRL